MVGNISSAVLLVVNLKVLCVRGKHEIGGTRFTDGL